MQIGTEPKVDDAITEIAALLAAAYQRCASFQRIQSTPEALPSTKRLAIPGQRSVHELTLTRRREESPRS
jgi:hypothetical protein